MKKFIETLTNVWKIEELRNRIILTIGILLVYRFGAHIILPGIDAKQLSSLTQKTSEGGLLDILNAFTGGAFAKASVFALGIMPYIYRGAAHGNCYPLFAKTTTRRGEWP